jgi:hypothetical protein
MNRTTQLPVALLASGLLTFSMLAAVADPQPLAEVIQKGFPAWDADHDGALTLDEVNWALANPEVRGEEAAAVAAIYRAARNKSHPMQPPFALADLVKLDPGEAGTPASDEDLGMPKLGSYYAAYVEKIGKAPHQLFVTGAPSLDGFRQGKIGSCFCLAPMAALINRDPAAVAARFTRDKDGFTVRLNGSRTVHVTEPTDGEIAISSGTGDQGYWSTVYEKAVGQMRIEDKSLKDPPLVAATAGSAGTMVKVLTGNEIKRFSCSPWRKPETTSAEKDTLLAQLRTLLKETSAAHRLITAGTGAKGSKVPGISSLHAYAVLGFDADKDSVIIRDPHGQDYTPRGTPGLESGYPASKGVMEIPLKDIVQFMGGFAFEQTTPAKKETPSPDTTADGA